MSVFACATGVPSRRALACALAAALLPNLALAIEETDGDKPVTRLESVVVIGTPVQPLTFETDPKLPRQPVPASDGADYLKTIPGFSALRNGGTNGDPVLRGMFGSRLSLLTSDASMPGACPSRMDNAMSYIAPETFDTLVVVKGPQTVRWGPVGSAGTVRFTREVPRFDSMGLRAQGSLLGGSFGRNDQVLELVAGAPKGYVRLGANRSESGDYRDGNGLRVPSAWNKWNADLALGWTPDAETVLEVALGAGDAQARYAARSMDGAQFRRDSLGLRFEKAFTGRLRQVQASAYRNVADHLMDNYSLRSPNPLGSMPMPMASNVARTTQGGRVAVDWAWEKFELTAGLDTLHSVHRRRSAMGRGAYRAQPWTQDARFSDLGVFGEATWTLGEGHRLLAGLRVDWAEATDRRAMVGKPAKPNPTFGQTRAHTLPAGFVRYERGIAASGWGWYAGLGHTRRMPDYWELFSPDLGPVGAANAFAGVRPEKTTQIDAGLQWRGARGSAWASGYLGRIDDFILFRYMPGGMMGPKSKATNVDARIHGLEAGGEFRPGNDWTVGGNLAWAWGSNRDAGTALPQMTPLEVRLSAAWEKDRWSAGALLRLVAAQRRAAPEQGNVVGQDLGPSPGFATLAINGGYRFNDRLQLTVGIDNLFDRAYAEHLNLAGSADFGYPALPVRILEPGRSLWLKLILTP
ncbi:TonB-dependent copper receptor [Thermomonas sp.]|uniref:TonB-dependent copper receptor n=1 Tax=Thermomonas sp. TaxID=1971895 RepID=UPI002602FA9F|nr:TonB-dependent copper receptor [Thermomonas sp.]MCO5055226.1 TonB-dependent copper receptor [Thermomonas sp.]